MNDAFSVSKPAHNATSFRLEKFCRAPLGADRTKCACKAFEGHYHQRVPRRPFESRSHEWVNCPPLAREERARTDLLHPKAGRQLDDGLYRWMVEATHEGIWMADLKGVCTFANAQMARMLASTPEQMVGRSVFDFVFKEDRAVVREHHEQLVREPVGKRIEERLRRSDGVEIFALVAACALRDTQGRPVSLLGMFTDITDRVRAERALQEIHRTLEQRVSERTLELQASNRALAESEEKYRQLFQTISDAAYLFDDENTRFLEVNEAALRLYGYSREDFLQLTYHQITAEPDASELVRRLILAEGAAHVPLRRHRKADGSIVPVELFATTFRLAGRLMVCVVARDLSRRVELEREILAISELEKRRLGQDLHDDLCQQLAGIEFLSRRLAKDLAEAGKAEAAQAEEIAQMLQRAMAQTRDLARGLSPVRLEAQGLADALRELAQSTRKLFRCGCRFDADGAVSLSNHKVAMHLYRIAQEAVTNALKHGKARHIRIGLAADGPAVTMTVVDDGKGLPADVSVRDGMGLRIMRYRAEVVGGTLLVERRPEGGTRVACSVTELPAGKERLNAHEPR